MPRNDLIEAMARDRYERDDHGPWEELSDGWKEMYRLVIADEVPAVVAFVAAWMDEHVCVSPNGRGGADRSSQAWREDMGA